MKGKPTSIRLTEENDAKIKAVSKRDNRTISQIINKIIDSYSAERERKPAQSSEFNELIKRIDSIEKELSLQRQRINIFRNQIDYIIKTKNGKYKQQDRDSRDNSQKQSLDGYKK